LPVFLFQEGDDPEATRTFREIARLTGAPIAGSIQAQPGSWRPPARGSLGMGWRAQALLASGNAGALKSLYLASADG
jgi:hypothetical protein